MRGSKGRGGVKSEGREKEGEENDEEGKGR